MNPEKTLEEKETQKAPSDSEEEAKDVAGLAAGSTDIRSGRAGRTRPLEARHKRQSSTK